MTDKEKHRFYKSAAWQAERIKILRRDHWQCQECLRRVTNANREGRTLAGDDRIIARATQVHHIIHLQEFPCVLTPDFSLYMDMPMAMKIWNIYRSRLIGQMMQDAGITVIPTLSWAEPETFVFCFDGLKPGGTVAVSTVGVMRDEEARKVWSSGMTEAIRKLQPKQILCYGSEIDYDFKDIPVQHFEARKFSE